MILFLHIPKTGGTTFNKILNAQYPVDKIYTVGGDISFAIKSLIDYGKVNDYELISGHFGFGLHKSIDVDCQYVTFVRDPVKRMVSHYYHSLRSSAHYLHEQASEMEVDEYVLSGITSETDNSQVRAIAGVGFKFGECNKDILEIAKRNMRKYFAFIGITSEYDRSLEVLYRRMKWKPIEFESKNVGKNKKGITKKQKLAIREFNKWDLRLVEYAETLLV